MKFVREEARRNSYNVRNQILVFPRQITWKSTFPRSVQCQGRGLWPIKESSLIHLYNLYCYIVLYKYLSGTVSRALITPHA